MAALVQSFPSQSSTMLQSRPSSSSGILQPSSQNQLQPQFTPNTSNRNSFAMASTTYRAPMAPYAFTSTPALSTVSNGQRPQAVARTSSAPNIPAYQQAEKAAAGSRSRYPASASISTDSSTSSSELSAATQAGVTRDDSALISTAQIATRAARPTSTIITSPTSATFSILAASPAKPSPDRYRRPAARRAESSASGQNLNHIYGHTIPAVQPNAAEASDGRKQQMPYTSDAISTPVRGSVDDMHLTRSQMQDSAAKRYRRRSIHTIDSGDYTNMPNDSTSKKVVQQSYFQGPISSRSDQHPLRSSPVMRPSSSHGRSGSSDSFSSFRSNHSKSSSRSDSASKREGSGPLAPIIPVAAAAVAEPSSSKVDPPRLVNIPPRGSSDAAKRIANPSPLSKPITMSPDSPASKDSFASAVSAALQTPEKPSYAQVATNGHVNTPSPAAQQLAALSGKDGKKSKSSRLRRAFSFGSAAELRKASAANSFNAGEAAADRSRLRKERFQDEQEAEQARIAQQQEAGGIGESIYSGQGNFFTGSTDNLSISSTASSASIMIRKMGKSMKKSTRSLAGLFRPKSVIGVPAADSAIGTSEAQVTMLNVEAEREKVNVNANPHDQAGGGTGFPKLERNSIDAANATATLATAGVVPGRIGSSSTDTSTSRRSIVGGEKERAEILNAVKKGILKRSGTSSGNSSPIVKPSDSKASYTLPMIPHINESPVSTTPSTPNDDGQRHATSANLPDEDYFMAAVRFRGDSKSAPGTPQGRRNVTFNLQLNNHDTWPSGEYDRRGEIATCNRLTPMLAQQIKEELNTFKMEMEVHDSSKIYTHFF